ncbi:hypothetical protein P4597_27470 [Peribacillus simplex]|uniref:hypothetical protein n=1 Tax=Peribacillus simplex TaxID=1478 RepID=UPI002E1DFAB0|nr:hypothetical protein [Peribacillus simplex]
MLDEKRLEEVNRNTFAYAHKLREIGLESDIVFLLQTIELLQQENEKLKAKRP